jgi:guanylate kinase
MEISSNIFIISAPSGSGKTTLVDRLVREVPSLAFSVSHTTRSRKEEEREGEDYHFVSRSEFEQMIQDGQFVEHAQLYGDYYGTSRAEIERILAAGKDVVLDIDTEGASLVTSQLPDACAIFVFPPSYAELERRLKMRQRDSLADIEKRLKWAMEVEIHRYSQYDYVIVNDELGQAFDLLKTIVLAQRARTRCMAPKIQAIINSFGGLH